MSRPSAVSAEARQGVHVSTGEMDALASESMRGEAHRERRLPRSVNAIPVRAEHLLGSYGTQLAPSGRIEICDSEESFIDQTYTS